ncbi:putative amidohydrolase [Arenicella xantha]|uniref:Putative amidohydrolase n=2 Tax=Arenicella xantha TaxID=644221 RepID=A0A395JP22_9GAMM|nr:putative amidohydrolase [Arenicella xantha]
MLRIGCLEMSSGPDVQENLNVIAAAVDASPLLDLLVLPENAVQMPSSKALQYVELASGGIVQSALSELAASKQMAILLGSLAVVESDGANRTKPYARSLLFDPLGKLVAAYDKLHLFDVDTQPGASHQYRESDTYRAGVVSIEQTSPKQLVFNDLPLQLGLTICYDLRFPELYRLLAQRGAQLICVPAAFTYETGKAHWETMLRCRAIENQVFIAAAAQVGKHASGRRTWGHSMIIDPWGEIITEQTDGQGLVFAEIDLTKIESLKERFPVHLHRRL